MDITEYQAHGRTCPGWGAVTSATIPAAVRAPSIEPRLAATVAYRTGCQGLSKRSVEAIIETLFGVPLALGTLSNLEQEVSQALAPAHAEARTAVQQAAIKYADETSWKLWGQLCWLWAAATTPVVALVIHARRSGLGLAALLDDEITGILHNDRWHVYAVVPDHRRQLCWVHLKRDFQALIDHRDRQVQRLGQDLMRCTRGLSALVALPRRDDYPCRHATPDATHPR